ncbi:cation channel family domain-containing protein, putative [Eimeria maxima]|uniref:Cation channel family domain-containing protein, putative n=1 Tax=Eimeria maxima TaxID=5804 RepID=U6M5U7_EIMMA|nr:cation channel family domain-containing protein, putative [Eimeria maxima]CDJ59572.1 cation channel family domain-containing protein, putative [Eimeria maxima]
MELYKGLIECSSSSSSSSSNSSSSSSNSSSSSSSEYNSLGLLNFNDIFSSLVTLFLLTVNGWDDSLKVLVNHTSVLKCSLYFVSFYILTDTILLNLLVALVLEAYEQISATPSKTEAVPADQQQLQQQLRQQQVLLQQQLQQQQQPLLLRDESSLVLSLGKEITHRTIHDYG